MPKCLRIFANSKTLGTASTKKIVFSDMSLKNVNRNVIERFVKKGTKNIANLVLAAEGKTAVNTDTRTPQKT